MEGEKKDQVTVATIKRLKIGYPKKFFFHFEHSLINQSGKKMSAPWGFGECVQFSEINHMAKNQRTPLQGAQLKAIHCPYLVFRSLCWSQPTSASGGQVFPILCLV